MAVIIVRNLDAVHYHRSMISVSVIAEHQSIQLQVTTIAVIVDGIV